MNLRVMDLRKERLHKALFRGESLGLANPAYLRAVGAFLDELLSSDLGAGDLTAQALQLQTRPASAAVIAKVPGVAAGLCEFSWLQKELFLMAKTRKKDGEAFDGGETLLEIYGRRDDLLAYERVGLNLVQRLSGIATTTRRLQDLAHRHGGQTEVVGTRKTPWGLLDKRAVHMGGGGTHRLGLWDGILVKNNHLALLADREEDAVGEAAQRAWAHRETATFIEIEVRSRESAVAAARAFRDLQSETPGEDAQEFPCLLMLDNRTPEEVSAILDALRREALLDHVLLEDSGNISEDNLEAYAACGVDAVSIGALTHSTQALDICQRLSEHPLQSTPLPNAEEL